MLFVLLTSGHVLLFSCLAGTLAAAIPAVIEGPIKPWNIKGNLLVLDVSSLKYQGGHDSTFPDLRTPEECAGVCNKTVGCNAWTYCNSTTGCGSGCEEYVKANPQREYTVVATGSKLNNMAHATRNNAVLRYVKRLAWKVNHNLFV
jgi:hypothetical protein